MPAAKFSYFFLVDRYASHVFKIYYMRWDYRFSRPKNWPNPLQCDHFERDALATRSPCRPNPLGITLAEILTIEGNRIRVTGLDALNGTPVLDIKPYEEHFDSPVGIEKRGMRGIGKETLALSIFNYAIRVF